MHQISDFFAIGNKPFKNLTFSDKTPSKYSCLPCRPVARIFSWGSRTLKMWTFRNQKVDLLNLTPLNLLQKTKSWSILWLKVDLFGRFKGGITPRTPWLQACCHAKKYKWKKPLKKKLTRPTYNALNCALNFNTKCNLDNSALHSGQQSHSVLESPSYLFQMLH